MTPSPLPAGPADPATALTVATARCSGVRVRAGGGVGAGGRGSSIRGGGVGLPGRRGAGTAGLRRTRRFHAWRSTSVAAAS